MKKVFLLIAVLVSLISCDKEPNADYLSQPIAEESEMVPMQNAGINSSLANSPNLPINRKMIWTGNLEFQVEHVNNSTDLITGIIKESGGFISDMRLTSNTHEISNSIKIRIENEKFQGLIESLKNESQFIKKIEINSNDVTEEFIDIESRLKTKRDVRDRYIKILNTKTGDVKDVIAAEEAIRKITEEIEAKEGRLRFLKDKVKFSTINLRIYQEVKYTKEPDIYVKSFTEKAGIALTKGWRMVTGFVLFFLTTWPFWIIVILLGIWKRKWLKSKIGN
jgi:hypothetical protein